MRVALTVASLEARPRSGVLALSRASRPSVERSSAAFPWGRWGFLAELLVCAVLAVLIFPLSASAEPADYLALGDSVAFGYRSGLAPAQYADPTAFVGYPQVLAGQLGLQLTNAACPGETTSSFLSTTGVDNGCREYRAAVPLHTDYVGTQADFAVDFLRKHPQTRLVTIDLGANDLFLLQGACQNSIPCIEQGLPAVLQTVGRNLNTIDTRLRREAGYQRELVALTYYVTDYRDPNAVQPVVALNVLVLGASLFHLGRVADGFGAFALASRATQGDACAAGLLAPLGPGCDIHPSLAGHTVLAAAIRAVIR